MLFLYLSLALSERVYKRHPIIPVSNDETVSTPYVLGRTRWDAYIYYLSGSKSSTYFYKDGIINVLDEGKIYDDKFYKVYVPSWDVAAYVLTSDIVILEYEPTPNYEAGMLARKYIGATYSSTEFSNTYTDVSLIQHIYNKIGNPLEGTVEDWFANGKTVEGDKNYRYGDVAFFGSKSKKRVAIIIGRESESGRAVMLEATKDGDKFHEKIVQARGDLIAVKQLVNQGEDW